ncbi:hypothetical protein J2S43_004579 [Catenuloplanes nepalensis]|uniref:Uncharacterized protein n=1 Tax=Catenuloplanes nepalensis TaxID=587533 RepID=A0ABT9MX99_9ACTN|nr:hypothetical protein [Catenuloplanes nepalensis]MDP9796067.1 hypothetical protein [Catenuloplanes nepalensis]
MSFLTSTFVTAFEAACLIRCARPVRPAETRRPRLADVHRVAAPQGDAVAEFDREEAAERLTMLLAALGYHARSAERDGGGVRRYAVQQVTIAEPDRAAADRMMVTSWQRGRQRLLATDPLGSTSPQAAHRVVLARAAWNAGVLVGRLRPRHSQLRIGIAEPDMVAVLVRAARLGGVTSSVSKRSGCFVIAVPEQATSSLVSYELPGTTRAVRRPSLSPRHDRPAARLAAA